jgi:GH24 family phage-related lysozyme (muramidase)
MALPGPTSPKGTVWTREQADIRFITDLDKFAAGVDRVCPETTPLQRGAMVSLAYNIGIGAFKKSSVARLHNAKRYGEAGQAFALFNKARNPANGKLEVSSGLVARRGAEAAFYIEGTPQDEKDAIAAKPVALPPSRTIAGASIGGSAVVASQAAEVVSELDWLKDQFAELALYLPIASKVLIVLGLAGIAYAAYARWSDKNTGRS